MRISDWSSDVCSSDLAASADSLYCEQRRLGYWFYCVRPEPKAEPQIAQPPAQVTATQELDAVTGELRELKARAILYPTPENVTAYIRFQRAQLDRASLFSDVWPRAIWPDPELDYTLERPEIGRESCRERGCKYV